MPREYQADIFGPVPRARKSDPDTSHAAALSMAGEAGTQRRAIYDALTQAGPLTADELDELLDLRITSAGRRLKELEELQLVQRRPDKRMTRSGRQAYTWEAVV